MTTLLLVLAAFFTVMWLLALSVSAPLRVQKGQKWMLTTVRNPWDSKITVAIVDEVREGWVRYHWEGIGGDQKMPCRIFRRIYRII